MIVIVIETSNAAWRDRVGRELGSALDDIRQYVAHYRSEEAVTEALDGYTARDANGNRVVDVRIASTVSVDGKEVVL